MTTYMVPSVDYMDRLMREARLAHVKATNASNDYNRLAGQAEDQARARTVGQSEEARRLAVKFARKGVTEIGDAERQYLFWRDEQNRLCAMIQAELALYEWVKERNASDQPEGNQGVPVKRNVSAGG